MRPAPAQHFLQYTALSLVVASAFVFAGCASSKSGTDQEDPQRRQQRPPAANELPPPSSPGSISRGAEIRDRTQLRESAIATLETLLGNPDPAIRANATEGLLNAPARLKPRLPSLLDDASPGVRAVACIAAGDAGFAEFEPMLRRCAADTSPFVRASAVYALNRVGAEVNPTPLAEMLMNHPQISVRAHAATLIGRLGNESALPMLRQAAAAPTPRANRNQWRLLDLQIAEAMVRLGDESRLDVLRSALYQTRAEDIEIALVAAQILGDLNDRASVSAMVNLAGQTDPSGREMPIEVQLGIASALARMDAFPNEPIAIGAADDASPAVRAGAAHALSSTGTSSGVRALQTMLADPEPYVRVAAGSAVLRRDANPNGGGYAAGVR